ncbi:Hypothetical_protein [Hexamita inflata]|uniref:Hypothetical_protein n=1 Tax=Hexamita inflata TaxID=28002 RepID=A0AA86PS92_9EUKA|nr:Hypothetical protein HINF_LOCUS27789 [Hexamita inflata]
MQQIYLNHLTPLPYLGKKLKSTEIKFQRKNICSNKQKILMQINNLSNNSLSKDIYKGIEQETQQQSPLKKYQSLSSLEPKPTPVARHSQLQNVTTKRSNSIDLKSQIIKTTENQMIVNQKAFKIQRIITSWEHLNGKVLHKINSSSEEMQ